MTQLILSIFFIIVTFNNCKPSPSNLSLSLMPLLCKGNSVHLTLAVRTLFPCKHSLHNTWLIYSLSSRDFTDH